MNIRRATPEDAPAIRAVHSAAIRGICASVYAPDEVDAWTSGLTLDRYVSGMERLEFLVAEQAGSVIGFAAVDLPCSEVHALYVAPSITGQGVGSALLDAAEGLAFEAGLRRLTLKATLNAVTFYELHGYSQVEPVSHPLPSGETLRCVLMDKTLETTDGAA